MDILNERINARGKAMDFIVNSNMSRGFVQSDCDSWLLAGTIANRDSMTAHKGIFNFQFRKVFGGVIIRSVK